MLFYSSAGINALILYNNLRFATQNLIFCHQRLEWFLTSNIIVEFHFLSIISFPWGPENHALRKIKKSWINPSLKTILKKLCEQLWRRNKIKYPFCACLNIVFHWNSTTLHYIFPTLTNCVTWRVVWLRFPVYNQQTSLLRDLVCENFPKRKVVKINLYASREWRKFCSCDEKMKWN